MKNIRTKPNARHRAALKDLEKKHFIHWENLGLKSVIPADGSEVKLVGLNLSLVYRDESIVGRHAYSYLAGLKLEYNNRRATMGAYCKPPAWIPRICDPSLALPRNLLAEKIFIRGNGSHSWYNDSKLFNFYGDAVLIHDVRRHWILESPRNDVYSLEDFDKNLTTPHHLVRKRYFSRDQIVFEEEPNAEDISFMSMALL